MKKPTGYGEFMPLLHVRDLVASVAFYRDVLGFAVDDEMRSLDFALLWAGDGTAEIFRPLGLQRVDDEHPPVRGQSLVVHVDNLADMLQRHRAHGAALRSEIVDLPWGLRQYCVEDPDGYRLLFREGGYDVRTLPPVP